MTIDQRSARGGAAALMLAALCGCANVGGLGGVGGSPQSRSDQVTGTVLGVDARARQIGLRLSNGQTVALVYDNQTQVVYRNQNYQVVALERGDQVTARIQNTGNAYYTDLVQVNRSVSSVDGGSAGVQALQGRVRQVDRSNGLFTLDANDRVRILVSLPARISRADVNTFQRLRPGDFVRLYGVFVTNSRVELRQFY